MESRIEINEFVENEDGSADMVVTMDYDTLVLFARKGLLAAIRESADKVLEENVPHNEEKSQTL